ncbi:adhesion G-protein coupled receptor G6-like, partial [Octopus bimaculoides]|uniref:adhesion G-protein coupled receptor G6-like n=1 Tax=Octopus bimaculoides TaxID=37653 RepID=UPI0022DFFBE0
IYNNSDSDSPAKDMVDFISLPKSLLKDLKTEERSNVSRISFLSMKDDKLYRVKQNSSTKVNTTVISNIIAATIHNTPIMDLDEPVTISVNLKEQVTAMCSLSPLLLLIFHFKAISHSSRKKHGASSSGSNRSSNRSSS